MNHQGTKDTKMAGTEPTPLHDRVAKQIVDAAFHVHKSLGPGLLESVYEQCLCYELESRNMTVARQVSLPVQYREIRLEAVFRIDLIVNDLVIVEIKSVEALLPIHEAQLLTYLKLSSTRLGFLINFNVTRIKEGIRRRAL
jgi:GxxExxY protein